MIIHTLIIRLHSIEKKSMNTDHTLQHNILFALLKSLNEAKISVPAELSDLTANLELKFVVTDRGSFQATKTISEKKFKDQRAFETKWNKLLQKLSKNPWKKVNAVYDGWNGQTDTGGTYSRNTFKFRHNSGLVVSLSSSTSFKTGTKTWTIIAYYETNA